MFSVSSVLTTQDANLIEELDRQRAMAQRSKNKNFFQTETLITDTMSGLYVDPRMPELTFVTPSSWIFHSLQYSAVCKFSVVCTVSLRIFSSSYVRELTLLYARLLYLSTCFQSNDEVAALIRVLDESLRQADQHQTHNIFNLGYTNDLDYLDIDRVEPFWNYFFASKAFENATLYSMICENDEKKCVLATHQAGFYLNSLIMEEDLGRVMRKIRTTTFHQECFRFSTMMTAPVVVGHEIGQYHRLSAFVAAELKTTEALRVKLLQLSEKSEYRLPMISSKEYRKRALHSIMARQNPSSPSTSPAASSSASSFAIEDVEEKEEEVEVEVEEKEKDEFEFEKKKVEIEVEEDQLVPPKACTEPKAETEEPHIADESAGVCSFM